MKKLILGCLLLQLSFQIIAQNPNKKTMDHDIFDVWNTIEKRMISNDGNWVVYSLTNEGRDPQLKLYHVPTKATKSFPRGVDAKISMDNQWLVFKIKQPIDSLKNLKRKKVKKKNLPKDSLGIYQLNQGKLNTIANVQSFALPKKWSGWMAYHFAETPPPPKDSLKTKNKKKEPSKKKKGKKANKKNGTTLVIHQLATGSEQNFDFVTNYTLAEEGKRIAFSSTGKDSTWLAGVYLFD